MATKDLLYGLYLTIQYKYHLRDSWKIINDMAMWLRGMEEEQYKSFSLEIAEQELIPRIRPSMLDEIQFHKENQGNIVLLSAALNYTCDPIAKHLGIDGVICSRLESVDGIFTGKSFGRLNFGDEKLIRMKAYCEQLGCRAEDDYYYADAISDAFVLEKVGHPVCVEPDLKLRRLAKSKGWRIIE